MLLFTLLQWILNILALAVTLVLTETDEDSVDRSFVTSMTNKLYMLQMERTLINNLVEYVDKLQEKTDTLRRLAQEWEDALQPAEGRERAFLSNPLHTFSLIRHMHADWPHLEKLMQQPVGSEQIDVIKEMRAELPVLEDVKEATAAIYRVQLTYGLEPADMAKGLLNGVQINAKLSFLECYEMGVLFFELAELEVASKWLMTALQLMDQSQSDLHGLLNVSRSDISSLLARSLTAEGNLENARAVLMDEPKLSTQAEELLAEYMEYTKPENVDDTYIEEVDKSFTQLCGSSYKPKPSRLVCSYKTTSSKFLRLAPYKMEQLSTHPYVVAFHDVIYESEIAQLIQIGEPLLEPTSIENPEREGKSGKSSRSARGAWLLNGELTDLERALIYRIQKRVEDMTELNIKGSSQLEIQFLNYVFGGHYSPHFDFFNSSISRDNRLATAIFYLNDVPSGGATIFPNLELVVKPERGKVLHWYNIMPDTYDFDKLSLHAACPVLIDEKLAITNWIYERDQMFKKPCLQPPVNRMNNFTNINP